MATLAFVHAHPDDEALYTAGTMARAVAEGHRVILITATDGSAGLSSSEFVEDLARHRQGELARSAAILGIDQVHTLGFPDSGLRAEVGGGFAHQPVADVTERITSILEKENIDVLVGYDPNGGYGHPDHRHVHRVVRACWDSLDRKVRLFEVTLPREPIAAAVQAAARLRLTPSGFDPREFSEAFTPRSGITHRVDVRRYLTAKRASLRAHASQSAADDAVRTLAVLAALPGPLFSALLGTEYYVAVT